MFKPRFCNIAVRSLVVGKFAHHRHFGAGVAYHIHKVVNRHVKLVADNVLDVVVDFLNVFVGERFSVIEIDVGAETF